MWVRFANPYPTTKCVVFSRWGVVVGIGLVRLENALCGGGTYGILLPFFGGGAGERIAHTGPDRCRYVLIPLLMPSCEKKDDPLR